MTSTAKLRRNWTYVTARVIVYTFLVAAAAGSFTDEVKCSHMLGLHWQAWTVPFLLDGVALMGKLGRSRRFASATQGAGLWLMVFGGLLSLAANVAAGENTGQRVYGALLVVGFLLVEWYAGKLSPAEPTVDPELVAARAAMAANHEAVIAANKRAAAAEAAAADAAKAVRAERRKANAAARKAQAETAETFTPATPTTTALWIPRQRTDLQALMASLPEAPVSPGIQGTGR